MAEEERFWELAEGLMTQPDVDEGTIMGHGCLRVGGQFAAMPELKTGGLVVKLSAARVEELIAAGEGSSFAPAGKVFKEWVFVGDFDESRWLELLEEAVAYARR